MLHTNMRCILSELMLHTEMYYVRTYVTQENMMPCVELMLIQKYVLSECMLHTKI